jgi:hypothetical protein
LTIYRGAGSGDRFTMILNSALQDRRLSYRARGILASVMSRPPGWRTTAERIAEEGKEGREAVLIALRELTDCNYLSRSRRRTDTGRYHVDWELTDKPELLKRARRSHVGFSDAGGPDAGVPAADSPAAGVPAADSPAAGVPAADSPAAGVPAADSPAAGVPAAGVPAADSPAADRPAAGSFADQGSDGGKTPPPDPLVDELLAGELERVVVVGITKGGAKAPGRPVLRKECGRLARLQWKPVQLQAVVEGHDWRGAGAGAVISFLRQLQSPSSAAQEAAQDRPDWCGACDRSTRLLEDPETHVPRRCPNCHPRSLREDSA